MFGSRHPVSPGPPVEQQEELAQTRIGGSQIPFDLMKDPPVAAAEAHASMFTP
jgi:hypothetical protein